MKLIYRLLLWDIKREIRFYENRIQFLKRSLKALKKEYSK
jgi:hypothetical protein